MSSLGIYFGPKVITLVVSKGKRVVNSVQISRKVITAGELEQKVPEEVMLVALLKDELRKNKFDIKDINDTTIGLSGKELIVRTFEIPMIPSAEVASAVNFEAKKYIPFKAEELISDFQLEFDKQLRRNYVLFMGVKKEYLEKYLSVIKQAGLKVGSLEYSAFSLLRCQRLAGIGDKGIQGVISMDFSDEDEVNFTVLKDGFPLFSRDISLFGESAEGAKAEGSVDRAAVLERLKSEIRVSLDYYHRKFPQKNIQKTFFLAPEDYHQGLESLCREIGLAAQFPEVMKYADKSQVFSLSFLKGFSCSLSREVKLRIKANLLAAKAAKPVAAAGGKGLQMDVSTLFQGLKLDMRALIFSLLICLLTYLYGIYRISPVERALQEAMSKRPAVASVSPDKSIDELNGISSDYKKRINTVNDLITRQMYLTDMLDALPRLAPDGLWLTSFEFTKADTGPALSLKGRAYLGNGNKEFDAVNTFVSALKSSPVFSKYLQEFSVVSLETVQASNVNMSEFAVSCRGTKR